MLVELRIGGGGLGCQTVFPGSTHEDTGEPITWEQTGKAIAVNGDDLLRRVRAVAAFCLIARRWPDQGSRHKAAQVLGGFLARAGKGTAAIKIQTEAIARLPATRNGAIGFAPPKMPPTPTPRARIRSACRRSPSWLAIRSPPRSPISSTMIPPNCSPSNHGNPTATTPNRPRTPRIPAPLRPVPRRVRMTSSPICRRIPFATSRRAKCGSLPASTTASAPSRKSTTKAKP